MTTELYETLGEGYAEVRRADLRIAAVLWSQLGNARSVLNVGAGAGSTSLSTARSWRSSLRRRCARSALLTLQGASMESPKPCRSATRALMSR